MIEGFKLGQRVVIESDDSYTNGCQGVVKSRLIKINPFEEIYTIDCWGPGGNRFSAECMPHQLRRAENPSLNMGKPAEDLREIKALPEPKVGTRFRHKKSGFAYQVVQVNVEQTGWLRDRAPDGDLYIYQCLATKRFHARSTRHWEREMREFDVLED